MEKYIIYGKRKRQLYFKALWLNVSTPPHFSFKIFTGVLEGRSDLYSLMQQGLAVSVLLRPLKKSLFSPLCLSLAKNVYSDFIPILSPLDAIV